MRAREAASFSRASALARASATSTAKPAIRFSVSGGKPFGVLLDATTAPHNSPPTVIGTAMAEAMPAARIIAGKRPVRGE